MNKIAYCTRIAAAACLSAASAAYAQTDHVLLAETLVANITPVNNEHATDPTYLRFAGINGATRYENRSVCASFITALLQQAYGWTSSYFKLWIGSTSPTAARYHDAIVAHNGFQVVSNINDIRAGDILAVKYSEVGAAVTGHIMIADDFAKLRVDTKPIVSNTLQYELKVIDSSSTGHGALTDTRMLPNKTWDAGAGRGTLRLYADKMTYSVVGYSWSTEAVSAYYGPQSLRHLVIGRLTNVRY